MVLTQSMPRKQEQIEPVTIIFKAWLALYCAQAPAQQMVIIHKSVFLTYKCMQFLVHFDFFKTFLLKNLLQKRQKKGTVIIFNLTKIKNTERMLNCPCHTPSFTREMTMPSQLSK